SAAGLLATLLFAFCPNLLAHSRIAANDMTCTIFFFIAIFALGRMIRDPTTARAVAAGIALGLALAAKLTAVLLLPLVALVFLLAWPAAPRAVTLRFDVLALTAIATLGACMGGTFDYAAYLDAFHDVYRGTTANYLYYLDGRFSPQPWWYYHLYAAAI